MKISSSSQTQVLGRNYKCDVAIVMAAIESCARPLGCIHGYWPVVYKA